MSQTADLGWCIAACRIELSDPDRSELRICQPQTDDEPDKSVSIVGLEGIVALRDLLNESIGAAEESGDLAREAAEQSD